jgi:hypothetical protein
MTLIEVKEADHEWQISLNQAIPGIAFKLRSRSTTSPLRKSFEVFSEIWQCCSTHFIDMS